MRIRMLLAFAAYIGAVLLPNLLIAHFGVVDVMPGPWVLMAPAAVYAVGLALVARDALHEAAQAWRPGAGTHAALAGITAGTLLSLAVADPRTAVASAAAFLLSECLDLAIYVPLRRRGWAPAALVSSYAGGVVDSLVFLWLAFGSLAFLPGQVLGKAVAVTLVVALVAPVRDLLLDGRVVDLREQPAPAR